MSLWGSLGHCPNLVLMGVKYSKYNLLLLLLIKAENLCAYIHSMGFD